MSSEPTSSHTGPLAEISHGPSAFEAFLDRNQKNLIILAILLAIAAAVYVVYDGVKQGAVESAGAALNKAGDLASLQAVAADEGTAAAATAKALLANLQWSEGQQDDALKTLQDLIADHPDHPAAESAKASLAAKLMAQGKIEEAKKQFQAVADSSDCYATPFALISLGDLASAAGDSTNAVEFYKKVQQDFPGNAFADTASRRLASQNAKSPVEIDPPPAASAVDEAGDQDVVSPQMSLPTAPAFPAEPPGTEPEP
jgi:predicted negative regulator of RcsB-dependent stress response